MFVYIDLFIQIRPFMLMSAIVFENVLILVNNNSDLTHWVFTVMVN